MKRIRPELLVSDMEFRGAPLGPLAQMNLIIGRNGAGKTELLEALQQLEHPSRWMSAGGRHGGSPYIDAAREMNQGLLLIDEMETGLHHSVFDSLWASLFALVQGRKLQVFATTHSQDCLRAFTVNWNEQPNADGLVLRLQDSGPVLLGRAQMMAAVRERIEVR